MFWQPGRPSTDHPAAEGQAEDDTGETPGGESEEQSNRKSDWKSISQQKGSISTLQTKVAGRRCSVKPKDELPGYQQMKLPLIDSENQQMAKEVIARMTLFDGLTLGFDELAQEGGIWAEVWAEEKSRWK